MPLGFNGASQMAKACPRCKLLAPDSALACECGHAFRQVDHAAADPPQGTQDSTTSPLKFGCLLSGWIALGLVGCWLQVLGATGQALIAGACGDLGSSLIFGAAAAVEAVAFTAFLLVKRGWFRGIALFEKAMLASGILSVLAAALQDQPFALLGIPAAFASWGIFTLLTRSIAPILESRTPKTTDPTLAAMLWISAATLLGVVVAQAESTAQCSDEGTRAKKGQLRAASPVHGAAHYGESTATTPGLGAPATSLHESALPNSQSQVEGVAPPFVPVAPLGGVRWRSAGNLQIQVINQATQTSVDSILFKLDLFDEFGSPLCRGSSCSVELSTRVLRSPVPPGKKTWVDIPADTNQALSVYWVSSAQRIAVRVTKVHGTDGKVWTGDATSNDVLPTKPSSKARKERENSGSTNIDEFLLK